MAYFSSHVITDDARSVLLQYSSLFYTYTTIVCSHPKFPLFLARASRWVPTWGRISSRVRFAAGWPQMQRELNEELGLIRSAGLWKSERVITTRQEALIGVGGREEQVLNFCANNYLGLSVRFGLLVYRKTCWRTQSWCCACVFLFLFFAFFVICCVFCKPIIYRHG